MSRPALDDDVVEAALIGWRSTYGSSQRQMMRAALSAAADALEVPYQGAVDEVRDLWSKARDERDDAIRLMSELMLCTPSIGEDKDGFVVGYVLPTGPLHRIAAYLTQHGQSFPQVRHYAEMKAEAADLRERIAQAIERAGDTHWPGKAYRHAARIARTTGVTA